MPRPEKVQAVAEIKERIQGARAVFLAEYAGLSVKDQQQLRRSLRAQGAEFKVVKMTLARRAAEELELEGVVDWLLGPTGLTFADADAVGAAKALKDFAKDHDVFMIKGGLLGDEVLTPERVGQLAEIEPRDVLLAKLAGAIKAPMANLAGLLAALPRNLASAMQQLVEKKDAAAPAAGPEDAAPEPAAAPVVADDEVEPEVAVTEGDEAAEEVAAPAAAEPAVEPEAAATDSDETSAEAEAPAGAEPEVEPEATVTEPAAAAAVEPEAAATDSDEMLAEAEASAAAEPELEPEAAATDSDETADEAEEETTDGKDDD